VSFAAVFQETTILFRSAHVVRLLVLSSTLVLGIRAGSDPVMSVEPADV
jgi:hypothetical protein